MTDECTLAWRFTMFRSSIIWQKQTCWSGTLISSQWKNWQDLKSQQSCSNQWYTPQHHLNVWGRCLGTTANRYFHAWPSCPCTQMTSCCDCHFNGISWSKKLFNLNIKFTLDSWGRLGGHLIKRHPHTSAKQTEQSLSSCFSSTYMF